MRPIIEKVKIETVKKGNQVIDKGQVSTVINRAHAKFIRLCLVGGGTVEGYYGTEVAVIGKCLDITRELTLMEQAPAVRKEVCIGCDCGYSFTTTIDSDNLTTECPKCGELFNYDTF